MICTVPSCQLPVPRKHYQHFTIESLTSHLNNAGFEIIDIKMIDKHSSVFSIISRIFVNRLYVITNRHLQNYLFDLYKQCCLYSHGIRGHGVFAIAKAG
jgi:hypothetical protein